MRYLSTFTLAFCTCLLFGQVTQYNDRPTWFAAVGSVDMIEDFEGFAADTDFKPGPVVLSIGTIQQLGVDTMFRNVVDVAPFLFTDNGGTNHASCFVDQDGPTTVRLTFDQPVSAWGVQLYGVQGGEFAVFDLLEGVTTLTPIMQDQFIGFTSTTPVSAVEFRSQTLIPGGTGEGFGADDMEIVLAGAQIPTLGQWGLMGFLALMGFAAIFIMRRNRA